MGLTLTDAQKAFMKSPDNVERLARWTLTSANHIAVQVCRDATLEFVANRTNPTSESVGVMIRHLSGGAIGVSDLVHLINGFHNSR